MYSEQLDDLNTDYLAEKVAAGEVDARLATIYLNMDSLSEQITACEEDITIVIQ